MKFTYFALRIWFEYYSLALIVNLMHQLVKCSYSHFSWATEFYILCIIKLRLNWNPMWPVYNRLHVKALFSKVRSYMVLVGPGMVSCYFLHWWLIDCLIFSKTVWFQKKIWLFSHMFYNFSFIIITSKLPYWFLVEAWMSTLELLQ